VCRVGVDRILERFSWFSPEIMTMLESGLSYRNGLQLIPLRSEVRVLGTDRFESLSLNTRRCLYGGPQLARSAGDPSDSRVFR
jgi:hypothetical protein